MQSATMAGFCQAYRIQNAERNLMELAISRSHGRLSSALTSTSDALKVNSAAAIVRHHVLLMTCLLIVLAFLPGLPGSALGLSKTVKRPLPIR